MDIKTNKQFYLHNITHLQVKQDNEWQNIELDFIIWELIFIVINGYYMPEYSEVGWKVWGTKLSF